MSFTNESECTLDQTEIACRRDEGAISPTEENRRQKLHEQIQSSVQDIEELSNGYAFRLPGAAEHILTLAEFITLERKCCPFFNFALEFEPDRGPVWLRLTGGEGVKEFLEAELAELSGVRILKEA